MQSKIKKPVSSAPLKGFTLIEMIVASGLFAVVMLIAVGTLVAVADADRRAQAIQSSVNNLNFAMDLVTRGLMTGQYFYCTEGTDFTSDTYPSSAFDFTVPQSCPSNGSSYITFIDQTATQKAYWYSSTCALSPGSAQTFGTYPGGCLELGVYNGSSFDWQPITSPEIILQDVRFFTTGAEKFAQETALGLPHAQPKVFIRMSAKFVSGKQTNTVHLQSSVTQRGDDN